MLVASGCAGNAAKTAASATASTAVSPKAGESATADASATGGTDSVGTTLGGVDSCTLLTPADFSAATTAVLASMYPASTYALRTVPTKTDVGPAVEQHSACTYHFTGNPGTTGEITLDVMTAAEYRSLANFDPPKPIGGLGDEAAVFGVRPAVRHGDRGALIANSSGSIAFATALLRSFAPRL